MGSMDKEEFLAKVREGHVSVAEHIRTMDAAELERPRRDDGWSARDVLAHLAAWYDVATGRLRLVAQDRADQIQWLEDDQMVDAWNAAFHAQAGGLGTDDVQEGFEQAHEALVSALESLPEDLWEGVKEPTPIERWLAACTFEHDVEHLSELQSAGQS
jgi:hypothetical protein